QVAGRQGSTTPSPAGSGATNSGGPAGSGANTEQPKPAPVVDKALAAASNLLPNETQVVYSVNVPKFLDSTLGGAAFNSPSGYQAAMFSEALGLPLNRMSRFIRAENL